MQEVIQLTTEIETNYPELYKYLNETPLSVGEAQNKTINTHDLKDYLATLREQLLHYLETHRTKK